MNWNRGLLRLWVVFAFSWTALILVMGTSGVKRYWPAPVFYDPAPPLLAEVRLKPPDCIPDDSKMDVIERLNSLKPSCVTGNVEPNLLSGGMQPPLRPSWYDSWVKFVSVLFLPPLLSLAGGIGIRWAVLGFAH